MDPGWKNDDFCGKEGQLAKCVSDRHWIIFVSANINYLNTNADFDFSPVSKFKLTAHKTSSNPQGTSKVALATILLVLVSLITMVAMVNTLHATFFTQALVWRESFFCGEKFLYSNAWFTP